MTAPAPAEATAPADDTEAPTENAAAEEAAPEAEAAPAEQPKPAPETPKQEGITGFRSASVKIPLELFPREMLKILLEPRIEYKPEQYRALTRKL